LAQSSGPRKFGILWSHNNKNNSKWLEKCRKALEAKTTRYVWWDVGWKPPKRTLPTGFIYTTVERMVTHVTSIESARAQPDEAFVRKVEANWGRLGLPSSENDPLHRYLERKSCVLTLLQLSKIEILKHPRKMESFKLRDGKSTSQPPRSFYYVVLP
jgi:hypothetical protein